MPVKCFAQSVVRLALQRNINMVKDIIEGLKIVSDSIKSVKKIVGAVNSGIEYLKT